MFLMRKLMLIMLLLLVGCQQTAEWHGKDISGLMPELQFELVNADAQSVTAADFGGKINLLFFGFTYCPDICPTTLAQLAAAIKVLPQELQQQVQVLFVSVDPERDSGQRLNQYAKAFGEHFTGLTGTQEQLQQLSGNDNSVEISFLGDYNVSHSSAVFAFAADGQAKLLLREDLSPQQIASDLQQLSNG